MGSDHQSLRQSEENLNRVRRLLGWTDAERCDNVRAGSLPHRNLQPGEFVLFVPYLYCGLGILISSFFMLLLEAFGLQLQHLTPHSILHAAIFAHFCEMFVGVPSCVTLFRHFFSVSAKWEHWHNDWVIIKVEPNDRLALPDSSPDASLPEWGATMDLPPEFSPVLARITELVNSGLTSMDSGGALTQLLLEEWVRCVTDESFSPEQLRLPSAIVPLCRDQVLRSAVLREMPMLDDGGLAARQLGGDPSRGVRIDDVPVGGSGARGTTPADKGKRPAAAAPVIPPTGGEEAWRIPVRGDGTFVSEPDPKRQRTSGEGSSSGQGERVPPSHPDQRQPQRRAPPPAPDQQRRPSPAPPASGLRQQQRPAPSAAERQPQRGSGLRGRWSAHNLRPTRPAGAFPPSGSGGRAATAEKSAPGGSMAEDASRARTTTEGPASEAGGPTPGGASGAAAAPRVPAGGAPPDAQSHAPSSSMPEGVAAQGPVLRAAPGVRTSEPSSPDVQTAGPRSPPLAEGELEEVLGRPLLPPPGGAPLPRVLRRARQALDDAQEAFRLEWARLQQERGGLDGWRARLGEQIKVAAAQHTWTRAELSSARTELDADRAAFHEDLQRLIDRERAVGSERNRSRWARRG
ncbi:hypothetical protein BS78_K065100 [Paspalum vaginatum]|uniref:Transposase (putative) gypsy type domain-containing protein n=1 Tax=Paspalum vaginatum TaxID=158149 RepID=A0A9W8CFV2_9POAL|nr:hypothetical protein BS78_K065100 [Paspalum vaginatum]